MAILESERRRTRGPLPALDPDQKKHLREGAVSGNEIVDNTARLAVMNMLLHGIGRPNGDSPIKVQDSLATSPTEHYSMVLTNPPFGAKSSITGHRR